MKSDHGKTTTSEWTRHIYRELNAEADKLANKHRDEKKITPGLGQHRCYQLFFDGSVTADSAGGGLVLYGSSAVVHDSPDEWSHNL